MKKTVRKMKLTGVYLLPTESKRLENAQKKLFPDALEGRWRSMMVRHIILEWMKFNGF